MTRAVLRLVRWPSIVLDRHTGRNENPVRVAQGERSRIAVLGARTRAKAIQSQPAEGGTRRRISRASLWLVLTLAIGRSVSALAQTPAGGTLQVTVVDPSGAVIVGATVTVTGAENANSAATVAPVRTSDAGLARVSGLTPGRYIIQGEFPGFEKAVLKDVRVRSGENRQVVVLPIARVETSVTVEQDRQAAAADPRARTFGTVLTREAIEALSDDPATLRQQLQDMAGPGAIIRVDSFEGGALPAKAQIRSIRISRDQFAAEYHSAGGVAIEIITQPGLGPVQPIDPGVYAILARKGLAMIRWHRHSPGPDDTDRFVSK